MLKRSRRKAGNWYTQNVLCFGNSGGTGTLRRIWYASTDNRGYWYHHSTLRGVY